VLAGVRAARLNPAALQNAFQHPIEIAVLQQATVCVGKDIFVAAVQIPQLFKGFEGSFEALVDGIVGVLDGGMGISLFNEGIDHSLYIVCPQISNLHIPYIWVYLVSKDGFLAIQAHPFQFEGVVKPVIHVIADGSLICCFVIVLTSTANENHCQRKLVYKIVYNR
jgi:hypothetical protein